MSNGKEPLQVSQPAAKGKVHGVKTIIAVTDGGSCDAINVEQVAACVRFIFA